MESEILYNRLAAYVAIRACAFHLYRSTRREYYTHEHEHRFKCRVSNGIPQFIDSCGWRRANISYTISLSASQIRTNLTNLEQYTQYTYYKSTQVVNKELEDDTLILVQGRSNIQYFQTEGTNWENRIKINIIVSLIIKRNLDSYVQK